MFGKRPTTPTAPGPKAPRLAELLGTANPAEQAARVQQLTQAATMPIFTLVITFDPRTGQTALAAPGQMPHRVALQMLEAARQVLLEQERSALEARKGQPTPMETPAPDAGA